MTHSTQKTTNWEIVLEAAVAIQARVTAGETVEELERIDEYINMFYDELFKMSPTPKISKQGETWFTYSIELGEMYLAVTPYMIVAGKKHGTISYDVPRGVKNVQVKVQLKGTNSDGYLVGLEIPNMTNARYTLDETSLDDLVKVQTLRYEASNPEPLIVDANSLFGKK